MASIKKLHLQYRLWIAEMNADINVLRIFDDYLIEMAENKHSNGIEKKIKSYKEQFISLRKEMDELRHEMHLSKMELAAMAKTNNAPEKNIEQGIHHEEINKRYDAFRKKFDATKEAFQNFLE